MTGPKVFVCDGIVPHSKVDFTGPKGVLECDGIVPHSCAGKTLQSCCLMLNFKSEDLVFYSVQCIYSHVYATNENEVVICHSGESGHFLSLFSSAISSVFTVVCCNL